MPNRKKGTSTVLSPRPPPSHSVPRHPWGVGGLMLFIAQVRSRLREGKSLVWGHTARGRTRTQLLLTLAPCSFLLVTMYLLRCQEASPEASMIFMDDPSSELRPRPFLQVTRLDFESGGKSQWLSVVVSECGQAAGHRSAHSSPSLGLAFIL